MSLVSQSEMVELICRQTTFTPEEALEKLEELKDPMKVIQSYMVPQKIRKPDRNVHQLIYHEISKYMEETCQQPLNQKR